MKTATIVFAFVWSMFVSLAPATGTTLIPMDLRDLTAKSELIFVGTVADITSSRDLSTIQTDVTFSDLRVLKGIYLEEMIQVRLAGGTVGSRTVRVFGMPEFVIGERNIIFLAGNFLNICPIVGWGQGRFKVRWDEVSRQEVVFDDRNVPVTEIQENEILRAKRTNLPKGSPGLLDRREVVAPQIHRQEAERRVSLERFIVAIETRMGIGPIPQSSKERGR